jgi:acyl-CoA synthetase (AMP-forming)/AMP-acid ligase II
MSSVFSDLLCPTKTFSILAAVARNQPDATAIVHQDKNLSYGDLFDAASSFAAKLAEAGLPSKSVVGLIGSKNIEFVLVFLALLHRGNPVVPLSIMVWASADRYLSM